MVSRNYRQLFETVGNKYVVKKNKKYVVSGQSETNIECKEDKEKQTRTIYSSDDKIAIID